ncbi:MAG: MFS transporter [Actinomycetota bacterium]|nr:MFS transporter [Actinomycetota bacterium]
MSSTGTAGGGTSASAGELQTLDEAPLSGAHWRWTAIAALGDYLDAGSIVAGGAALPLFTAYLHFGSTAVSLIAALGSNGVSTGIGALVAGRLGDRYGRKFIYSWDLLIYALGALVVALAVDAPMMIGGYMILGLAVGIDVPTSWSLIAELAPRKQRGKLMAFTNIFWYIGPIVILLLALAFHPLGLLGGRLLFVSLLVVALAAWLLRRQLTESPRWSLQQGDVAEVEIALGKLAAGATAAAGASGTLGSGGAATAGAATTSPGAGDGGHQQGYRALFSSKKLLKRLAFLMPIYLLWGLPAGTYGFFEPTLFKTVGAHSLLTSDGLDILWFGSAIIAVVFVFMPLNDRIDRRILYAISAAFCAAGFFLLVWAPINNIWVALGNILLFGFGQGIGLWPLQRIWSVELFPTELRNTAQGFLWAVMRILLGIWSYFLLDFTSAVGFDMVALAMALMFTYNFVVGGLLGPRTESMSLESI